MACNGPKPTGSIRIMKRSKNFQLKNTKPIYIFSLIALAISVILTGVTVSTKHHLSVEGQQVTGQITNARRSGTMRSTPALKSISYEFAVGGKTFSQDNFYLSSADFGQITKSDNLSITYSPTDPSISQPTSVLGHLANPFAAILLYIAALGFFSMGFLHLLKNVFKTDTWYKNKSKGFSALLFLLHMSLYVAYVVACALLVNLLLRLAALILL